MKMTKFEKNSIGISILATKFRSSFQTSEPAAETFVGTIPVYRRILSSSYNV